MFDTTVTLVGNALTTPEKRRTNSTGTLVTSFRVASTSRRFDRDSGRWVDGPSLRVRVTCWRRLAEGVTDCVKTGDPLIVTGRMYTRDWIADDGQHRVSYELEATAVGHDLSRGSGTFERHRPVGATSVVEDAEDDARIRGELSVPVAQPGVGLSADGPGLSDPFGDLSTDDFDGGGSMGDGDDDLLPAEAGGDGEPAGPDSSGGQPGAGGQFTFGRDVGAADSTPSEGPIGEREVPSTGRRTRGKVPVPV